MASSSSVKIIVDLTINGRTYGHSLASAAAAALELCLENPWSPSRSYPTFLVVAPTRQLLRDRAYAALMKAIPPEMIGSIPWRANEVRLTNGSTIRFAAAGEDLVGVSLFGAWIDASDECDEHVVRNVQARIRDTHAPRTKLICTELEDER